MLVFLWTLRAAGGRVAGLAAESPTGFSVVPKNCALSPAKGLYLTLWPKRSERLLSRRLLPAHPGWLSREGKLFHRSRVTFFMMTYFKVCTHNTAQRARLSCLCAKKFQLNLCCEYEDSAQVFFYANCDVLQHIKTLTWDIRLFD